MRMSKIPTSMEKSRKRVQKWSEVSGAFPCRNLLWTKTFLQQGVLKSKDNYVRFRKHVFSVPNIVHFLHFYIVGINQALGCDICTNCSCMGCNTVHIPSCKSSRPSALAITHSAAINIPFPSHTDYIHLLQAMCQRWSCHAGLVCELMQQCMHLVHTLSISKPFVETCKYIKNYLWVCRIILDMVSAVAWLKHC